MPRTAAANQQIRDSQRVKILQAAWKVFAQKGLTLTMADVAAAAEVSYGLTYRYFASKDALLQALLQQTLQSDLATPQRILHMPGTPGERLTFLVSRLIQGRREHPEYHQLFDQALSDETMPDELRAPLLSQARVFRDVLRRLIIEGQATGEVTADDPDQLMAVVTACLEGLTRWALRDPEQFNQHMPDARIILRILKP